MKGTAIACLAALLAISPVSAHAATGDSAIDAIINMLLNKGVISRDDAKEIEDDLKKGTADRKMPAETAQEKTAPATEAKEEKFKLPFEVKLRAQTRLDAGDLLVGSDDRYTSEYDLFLRRVRLEVDKKFEKLPVGRRLDLNLTLDADRADQDFSNGDRSDPSNRIDLRYIYGDWIMLDQLALKIGKHKLPFSRVSLTSSSRQLLIERPSSTEAAKDTFGDYQQLQFQIHGDVTGGAFRYYAAYCDGAGNQGAVEDLDSSATDVRNEAWGKAFIGRLEISPLIEEKKDDTGIGEENHLTFGIHGGIQDDIKYSTSSVDEANLNTRMIGADLAGRYHFGPMGTVTGQMEYVRYRKDFNYRPDEEPQGGYVQAGYLLPWTVLAGRLEPVARYEIFDHDRIENADRSGTQERTLSVGFNHYLLKHSLKWSYNYVHTRFDEGVAEAVDERDRNLHQFMLQLYF